MKATLAIVLLTAAVALATNTTANLPPKALNALTSIDTVPTKDQLNDAFDTSAEAKASLAAIATDTDPASDPGVRLRAIHALAKYCGDPPATPCTTSDVAHQSVAAVISETYLAQTGTPVLILRAAIETIGAMRLSTDEPLLRPLLDHPSRDIRAATARALRDLCNPQAITPLRARYSNEMTDQVKLAISEALRILGQCAVNP